jgi:hypothetical protein
VTPEESAVIEAARQWARADKAVAARNLLYQAVRALEHAEGDPETNQPQSHLHQPRAWGAIPAGWFIQVPSGDWWEVLATAHHGGTRQVVTLRRPDRQSGTWDRNSTQKVTCCPGTRDQAVTDALAALGGNVQVIEDQVS